MRKILLLLTILNIITIYSQSTNDGIDSVLKKSGIQRVFGEKGNIREKPDIKSKIQSQIPAGSSLKIIKRVEEYMTIDGVTDYWYQIQNASKSGYMWGGFLSDFISEQDLTGDGDKEIFLLRNHTKQKDMIHMKIVKGGKIISELEKKSQPISNFSLKVLNGENFDPKLRLFALYYIEEAESDTSYPKVDIYYLDIDYKLQFGFSYIEKGCDPPTCIETTAIFPGEIARGKRPAGEPNKVILHVHAYDLDNESKHEYSRDEYIWSGDGFLKNK
jgi:hypothetical protein